MEPRVTLREAARRLKLTSHSTVRGMLYASGIHPIQIGQGLTISESELEALRGKLRAYRKRELASAG